MLSQMGLGIGGLTRGKGVGVPPPPAGYLYLTDEETGAYLTDEETGAYLLGEII